MPSANESLFDAANRHQIFLIRYGGGLANKIIALLNRTDADLVQQIAARLATIDQRGYDLGPATTARLQKLLDEIRIQNRDLYVAVEKTLRDDLRDLSVFEADLAARRLNEAIGIDLGMLRPSPEVLRAAVTSNPFRGKVLKDWVKDMEVGKIRRLNEAIQIGMVEGETIDQIVRRIRGSRANAFRDGILEIGRRDADLLARTATNFVANRARDLTYAENRDVVSKVRWTATLDSRTSAVCRARDGKVYPIDSGPRPPAHPHCRSTMTPVLKSWAELVGEGAQLKRGRGADDIDTLFRKRMKERGFSPDQIEGAVFNARASMNGEVPGDLSYSDWLRRQPKAFQDEVLGTTKAALFRKGELPLDRFVDLRTGREYTLDELRQRESEAWMKAGLGGE